MDRVANRWPFPSPRARLLFLSAAFVLLATPALSPNAGAAAAFSADLSVASQPVVIANGTPQQVGNLSISVPPPSTVAPAPTEIPARTDIRIWIQNQGATNCSAEQESVGFSGLPTVVETTHSGSVPLAATSDPGTPCPVPDGIEFETLAPATSIQITNISYSIGPGGPAGPDRTGNCRVVPRRGLQAPIRSPRPHVYEWELVQQCPRPRSSRS